MEIFGITAHPDYQILVKIWILVSFFQSFTGNTGDLHLHAAGLEESVGICHQPVQTGFRIQNGLVELHVEVIIIAIFFVVLAVIFFSNKSTSKISTRDSESLTVEQYKEHKPNITFMDIVMPEKTGLEALEEIKAFDADAKVVMASTIGTQSNLTAAIKAGAFDFLQKPVQDEDIYKILNTFTKE